MIGQQADSIDRSVRYPAWELGGTERYEPPVGAETTVCWNTIEPISRYNHL